MLFLKSIKFQNCWSLSKYQWRNLASAGCTNPTHKELTSDMKHKIEHHWRDKLNNKKFDPASSAEKFYVLSMFPYPSGWLHMGHVRVYAISDAMARFYRLNGKNVLHPMGWDAFGLPAENAAIQRNISADKWTYQNIKQMRSELHTLGCSFDWSREFATCDPSYYKWTQKLFLEMYNDGLVYQKKALVNWDPVDKTVLADEQVDNNGCSWRSGAKVQKRLLKQWFVRTTRFAKRLYDGLDDPILEEWRDIIKLQKHWIGECNGFSFEIATPMGNLNVWTQRPEDFLQSSFVAIKSCHDFKDLHLTKILNPFNNSELTVVVTDDVEYAEGCESYLGSFSEQDKQICLKFNIKESDKNCTDAVNLRSDVLQQAAKLKLGGYPVSSKLKDWLISRQRYWGTPIPIIHCPSCGVVPVPDEQMPIVLPPLVSPLEGSTSLLKTDANWKQTPCPKCGGDAERETDTMDTFVDSAWYFLRFLDPNNNMTMFDANLSQKFMPVDLYIGGKEHAVLHLYYARFINYFMHAKNMVAHPEPFKRLLVQGMVMGRSFRVKGSGKYLSEEEVDIIDAKKNKAVERSTGSAVVVQWEKMSKSKMNGVNPMEMISEYGSDTTRLIILADVAPMSHRNWSSATFPGVLNWQKRLWATMDDFYNVRNSAHEMTVPSKDLHSEDYKMFDARNYYVKGSTFHYKHTHQLSVAISKMQGLTNSLKKASKDVMAYGPHFERALAAQIIMLSPLAPHFASELWAKFLTVPNRLSSPSHEIQWELNVLEQKWPEVDHNYELDLTVKINGFEMSTIKLPRTKLDALDKEAALNLAFADDSVKNYVGTSNIRLMNFVLYKGCEAVVNIFLDKSKKKNIVHQ